MKVYIMTDLECVAGVVNLPDYCLVDPNNKYGIRNVGRYYDHARHLATMEVNSAVEGLLEGGATEVFVCDGHGHGGLDVAQLHPSVRVMTGIGQIEPRGLDRSFDAALMIGQHARANTNGGHLCHSFSFFRDEERLNGEVVGEIACFMAMCGHFNIPVVMISGDAAAVREARELSPKIKAVTVIEGQQLGSTTGMTALEAIRQNVPATHVTPARAREMIREAANACLKLADKIDPRVVKPPFERVRINRPDAAGRVLHAINTSDDLVELMNQKPVYEPLRNIKT